MREKLITIRAGEPVHCSEHGDISPVLVTDDPGSALGAGTIALLHLKQVHGMDIEEGARRLIAKLKAR
jgi:hypothetical protein